MRNKTGGRKPLKRGHCLARTVYAANRVENNVYPVGAKVENLPNGQHKIFLVREDHLELSCTTAEEKK